MNHLPLIRAATLALLCSPLLAFQGLAESQKLLPPGGGLAGARFGHAVGLDGSTYAVGAPFAAPNSGRVLLYERSSSGALEFATTLFPQGAGTGECFGQAVDVDGDLVAVGSACDQNSGRGAVYVYRRTAGSWDFEARLVGGSSPPGSGGYGYAVDVDGDRIAVSDPVDSGTGRVFVYRWNGAAWVLEATLGLPLGSTGRFGVSLALDGDLVAVGVARSNGLVGGDVRLFRYAGGTWTFEQTVQPATAPYGQFNNDEFGASVALVRDSGLAAGTLLVGAPADQVPGNSGTAGRGAAFVFRRQGGAWSQTARLQAPAPVAGARFGASVELVGDGQAFVGADGEGAVSPPDPSRGAVFTFRRSGNAWAFEQRLTAALGAIGDTFGAALAATASGSGASLVIGAPYALGASTGAAHAFEVSGSGSIEVQRLVQPIYNSARFGTSVAVDGGLAVVGAPYDDTVYGANSGSAHVYTRVGGRWEYVSALSTSILSANDRFGSAVAISDGLIAVGAPNDDHSSGSDLGSVFLFEKVGGAWTLTYVLDAADGAAGDQFGTSVSIRAGLVAIGAPLDDIPGGTSAGSVYLYRRNGAAWSQAAKLASNDLLGGDLLGVAVAVVASNRVLVGAPGSGSGGAAYVFDGAPIIGGVVWSQRAKLSPSSLGSGDDFGRSVAASGQRLLIGAPNRDTANGVDAGAAYYFESSGGTPGSLGNTFTQIREFDAFAGAPGERFGTAVAVDPSTIVIGRPGADQPSGFDAGAIQAWRPAGGSGWVAYTLAARAGSTLAAYGTALAFDDGALLVGALFDTNLQGGNAGAVHVVDTWFGGAVGVNYCTAAVNASGQSGVISGSGSPVRSSNNFVLHAARLPQNSTSYFLASRTAGLVAQPGGSVGVLCLGGVIGRFVAPGQVLNSGASGTVLLPVDLTALPQPAGSVVALAGDTWHFQAWFRDIGPSGATSNFTDGLAVVIH